MTLQQRILQLLGQWDGLDASERSSQRPQLVADLVALLRAENGATGAGAGNPLADERQKNANAA